MKLTLLHRIKLCCEILTTRSGHGRSSHEKQLSVFQRGYDAGFRDVRLKHDYIEKMARENKVYVEGEDIYKEYRCGERVLKQFAEAYAAKLLEDKEREITELSQDRERLDWLQINWDNALTRENIDKVMKS